jgi:pimeloyl-ACP methyl ester carboxylesterase
MIQALGAERAHVVGHDWGGVLAWATAMWHPARVERLVVVNAPHPAAYLREIRRSWRQRARSWYVLFFQIPRLADWLLERDRAALIATTLRGTAVNPDAFDDLDLEVYRRAFSRPGALRGPLAFYRALGRFGLSRFEAATRRIDAPTLLLWGLQDRALVPELTEGLESWVPDLRVVREPQSGHWLQQEQPELVNRELLAFLAS